jgi:hypothetical protein
MDIWVVQNLTEKNVTKYNPETPFFSAPSFFLKKDAAFFIILKDKHTPQHRQSFLSLICLFVHRSRRITD